MKKDNIVGYSGECPLCGSRDGMIIKGADGRYRNMCRYFGCPAYYKPAPSIGYLREKDAEDFFEADIFKSGKIKMIGDYLGLRACKEVEEK